MKNALAFIFSFFIVSLAFPQQYPDNSLGEIRKLSKGKNSLVIETTNGVAQVEVYSPEIIRIRINKKLPAGDFSYAVTADLVPCNVKILETEGQILLITDSLRLQISTTPVRFTFTTHDGKTVINEDDGAFGTTWVGEEVTTFKKLQEGEKFIGLGEKTGNLDRRGEGFVNWNSDTPGYTESQDPIYASFPFYIGIHHNVAYGIFFDNTFKSYFNFGASNDRYSSFGADAGEMNYYFIGGGSVSRIIANYTGLTGRMPMPPIWGLGFQQSRWSYFPDSQVLDIARTFRNKKIPLDVLYLDIHYMDAYKVFTWHPLRFPHPEQMTKDLAGMGIHTAVIIDPGIKVEKGYKAYEDGVKKNMFIKYPDGTDYTAQVWPGWCNFPDFTMPEARKWWGNEFGEIVNDGVTGFWNDMNEIASWGAGKTSSIVRFNWEGKGASYREGKNVYGLLMARSTYEGTKTHMNSRPLVLTRAAFSGAQRYTAIWTGDNVSSDEHMLLGCRLVNSLGISGMPFCGTDVGGFMNGDAGNMLFTRWITIGTFTPFFRVHKHYDFKMSEPWSYGAEAERISRNYISLRYRLLPYLYSAFFEAHTSGIPVNRSLAVTNTFEEKCWYYAYQNQFMFGPSLLAAPVESTKELTKVYLPEGEWYDFFTGKRYEGQQEIIVECPLDKLPVFAKGGSFIPMQSIVQNTAEKPSDTLFLHVYAGNKPGEYTFYEDDGTTFENEKGNFRTQKFSYDPISRKIIMEAPVGPYAGRFTKIALLLHGFDASEYKINGKKVFAEEITLDLLTSLQENDPLYVWGRKFPQQVKRIMTGNVDEKSVIEW
ncbi:MAG TPA: glycoside hydrolase family 31 protein [Bacteroidales bacterium]|nr:glycoside hydrolase family 31 protein [Bacteroidales bacterium]HPT02441.1 glycoside hydrolase family 31 protein [Bacteroidales bacterium]